MTNNFNNTDSYIKREEANGLNLGETVAVTNKASGGTIGTAATTVDIAGTININQTTASQTLTVPDPTDTATSKAIIINNVGTQAFTMLSQTVNAAAGLYIQWNGAAWSVISSVYAGTFSGAVTATSVTSAGTITSTSATAGVGYATGAGGTVTQGTSKSTGVTLNKVTGNVISHNASLTGGASVSFTLTNSTIAAADVVVVSVKSGASTGLYTAAVTAVAAGSCIITITNIGSTAGEVVTINFSVVKSVAA